MFRMGQPIPPEEISDLVDRFCEKVRLDRRSVPSSTKL